MDFLYAVTVDPILQIVEDPVFFLQIILEGLMAGVMSVSYTHLTLPTNREV